MSGAAHDTGVPEMSVQPYWELTFDADGDVDTAQRDPLIAGVAQQRITDLLVFAHGWNNDRSIATRLYDRFFAPFPGLTGSRARLGYVGVMWPAMRFTDEPIPDFDPTSPGELAIGPPMLEEATRQALARIFPGRDLTLERIAQLLEEQPDARSSFDEFARLVRDLVSVRAGSQAQRLAEDIGSGQPAMLTDDPVGVAEVFTAVLEQAAGRELSGAGLKRLWNGAKEFLRQSSYYGMKRRSGVVGQLGLGPVLGRLARSAPTMRVHLIGHSFGARLVSYALRGMPEGVTCVKSTALLQGAFSHYAFARQLPDEPEHSGALKGMQGRVDGPLVSCFSQHDTALSVLYPLASKLAGDSTGFLGLFDRWGAIGHDGIQAVEGARRVTLGDPIPVTGCVSVDASSVVRRGGPPAGAHSDICHEELARVILGAGRVTGS
ncbi:serine-threonine protein kinase [Streptomyces sp. MST-110588]|uniref:serine-threonine protein kinase n=1 Tax=Streptomyces sp. MST-110588 TaxID=2833628 RepID=UPI001F5CFAFD|nr:serine-threonine protein kinase [Streptomyces sp. MST-110588]UNO42937.1 serine-threonine protein kinase [Streptomyces sp. MST-110588]